ncbi:MAG: hypothetical protein IT405_01235 [Candidatus Yanofskybacteria bacterium]|nr:hypothetical protein [Candidatus Yanofskybacteria bacterium]
MKKWLATACAVLAGMIVGILVWTYCTRSGDGPAVVQAKADVAKAEDIRKAGEIHSAGIAKRVECYDAMREPFDSHRGKEQVEAEPRVWIDELGGGRIQCFSGPGFSRLTGEPLKPVTKSIVRRFWASNPEQPTFNAPTEYPPLYEAREQPRGRRADRPRSNGGELNPIVEVDCAPMGCS